MTKELKQRIMQAIKDLQTIVTDHRPDDTEYLEDQPEVDEAIDAALLESDAVLQLLENEDKEEEEDSL